MSKETAKGEGRKIMIVIEEDKGGHGFNVYMAGDKERLQQNIPTDQMTAAEFWGSRLFQICVHAVRQAGAVQSETQGGGKDA